MSIGSDTTLPNELRLAEAAWGVIANAGGGDWTRETVEWQEAATRWRNEYHARLNVHEARLERAYEVARKRLGTRRSTTVQEIIAAYLGVDG